jgi:hypothetical protein
MNEVHGNAQNVSYYDRDLDQKLAGTTHNVLRPNDLPAGVSISFWKDQRGHLFFFQNGMDGRSLITSRRTSPSCR